MYLTNSTVGDCNQDLQLNVLDIIYLVNNCILLNSELDCYCGDMNNDNTINVLDVVGIVNLILSY